MCVVCDGDTGLRSAVMLSVTAELLADLVNYSVNIILRHQFKYQAIRESGMQIIGGRLAGPGPYNVDPQHKRNNNIARNVSHR